MGTFARFAEGFGVRTQTAHVCTGMNMYIWENI